MMGGVFPDFGVSRGRERWVEYFQISGLRGGRWVVGGVFSDFRASMGREWWMEYLQVLGLRGVGSGA